MELNNEGAKRRAGKGERRRDGSKGVVGNAGNDGRKKLKERGSVEEDKGKGAIGSGKVKG